MVGKIIDNFGSQAQNRNLYNKQLNDYQNSKKNYSHLHVRRFANDTYATKAVEQKSNASYYSPWTWWERFNQDHSNSSFTKHKAYQTVKPCSSLSDAVSTLKHHYTTVTKAPNLLKLFASAILLANDERNSEKSVVLAGMINYLLDAKVHRCEAKGTSFLMEVIQSKFIENSSSELKSLQKGDFNEIISIVDQDSKSHNFQYALYRWLETCKIDTEWEEEATFMQSKFNDALCLSQNLDLKVASHNYNIIDSLKEELYTKFNLSTKEFNQWNDKQVEVLERWKEYYINSQKDFSEMTFCKILDKIATETNLVEIQKIFSNNSKDWGSGLLDHYDSTFIVNKITKICFGNNDKLSFILHMLCASKVISAQNTIKRVLDISHNIYSSSIESYLEKKRISRGVESYKF